MLERSNITLVVIHGSCCRQESGKYSSSLTGEQRRHFLPLLIDNCEVCDRERERERDTMAYRDLMEERERICNSNIRRITNP